MQFVTSHQPAFLPWPGFWHKVMLCDMVILSCGVSYTRGGYINRVKGRDGWLTIPVKHPTQDIPIRDIRMEYDPEKMVRAIQLAYGGKKNKYASRLESIYESLLRPTEFLWSLNWDLLLRTAEVLGLNTHFLVDLDPRVGETAEKRWESRIREITGFSAFNPGVYIGGGGIMNYLTTPPEGIKVMVQGPPATGRDWDETILKILVEEPDPLDVIAGFCELKAL